MVNAKHLKEKYHEARQEAYSSGKLDPIRQNVGAYTPKMIAALRDMAKADVYPDGSFGDEECDVWSMFR